MMGNIIGISWEYQRNIRLGGAVGVINGYNPDNYGEIYPLQPGTAFF